MNFLRIDLFWFNLLRRFRIVIIFVLAVTVSLGLWAVSYASSPRAWGDFREDVRTEMEFAVADRIQNYHLEVDPYGTESYGIAVATGQSLLMKHRC
ncbi:MAG: hypothetical protein AAF327_18365 [Cyanobacteria bacterium P01_A01_bin.37]